MLKKLASAILSLVFIICITSSSLSVNAAYSVENGVTVEYYGRAALSGLPNAAKLLYAYDALVSGVEKGLDKISVAKNKAGLSVDEFKTVLDAYTRDHSEHFWLGSSYSYTKVGSAVTECIPTYLFSAGELDDAKKAFNDRINAILSGIDPSMSDFEKELYIHDTLAASVKYVDTDNSHNAYGAIVNGKAVCEGYAEAFQYLMQLCGIQSFLALGSSVSPSSGSTVGHMWNYFKIGGRFYHTDLTWDDQEDLTFHAYFNLTDSEIKADHTITPTAYSLPVCDYTSYSYRECCGETVETASLSTDKVSDALKRNGLVASFFVDSSVKTFTDWVMDEDVIREIAEKAGVRLQFRYGFTVLGKEVVLYVEPVHEHLDRDKNGFCDSCSFLSDPSLTEKPEMRLPDDTDSETDISKVTGSVAGSNGNGLGSGGGNRPNLFPVIAVFAVGILVIATVGIVIKHRVS